MIEVGSAKARQGEKGQGAIPVGRMAMGMEVSIPVFIVNGKEKGPVLWLNGAVHGDELNGFMAMRNVVHAIDPAKLRGTIVTTPLCNPLAVQWRNKINPWDYLDLDQQFPGKADGQYSQRTAHALFSNIKRVATHLVSFHTVGTMFRAQPYTVYKVSSGLGKGVAETGEAMALSFGFATNCRVDMETATGEVPGGVGGSIDINSVKNGIPAMMAEVGNGGTFDPTAIAAAEAGIYNVMRTLEMLDEKPVPSPVEQWIVTKRAFMYTEAAGFFQSACVPGQTLKAGEHMGRVVDLFETLAEVKAPEDVKVIMLRNDPVLHVGDRIAFFGFAWEKA